jgi:phospholipid/cholesterol/gamma-HCH transport system permease protein
MTSIAEYTDNVEDGRRVLRFTGNLTLARIRSISRRLDGLGEEKLLIDLSGVERMDTVGAGVIHNCRATTTRSWSGRPASRFR